MAFDAFVALQNRIPNRAFRLQIRDVDAAPSQSRFDKIGVRAPKRWWRWPSLVCSTVDRLRIQRRRAMPLPRPELRRRLLQCKAARVRRSQAVWMSRRVHLEL